jgi:hypothetical protein
VQGKSAHSQLGMATGTSPPGIFRTFRSQIEENLPVLTPVPAHRERFPPVPVPERGSGTRQGLQPRLIPEEPQAQDRRRKNRMAHRKQRFLIFRYQQYRNITNPHLKRQQKIQWKTTKEYKGTETREITREITNRN